MFLSSFVKVKGRKESGVVINYTYALEQSWAKYGPWPGSSTPRNFIWPMIGPGTGEAQVIACVASPVNSKRAAGLG